MKTLSTALGLLVLLCTTGVPFLADDAKPQGKSKKYKVIIRVVRPHLLKQPTPQEAQSNMSAYSFIANGVFHLKDPVSDTELLRKLNKHNPQFKFDHVLAKQTLEVEADKLWDVPESMTLHKIRSAIVDKNNAIMDTKRQELLKSANSDEVRQGKLIPDLHQMYTPEIVQKVKAENKTLLYTYHTLLKSRYGNKVVDVSSSLNGVVLVEDGTTFCFTSALYFRVMGKNNVFTVESAPTDVVILTILGK